MSIFVVSGLDGQIKTTALPSSDMSVSGPASGPLEQIMYEACRWSGRRNPGYGGWIIPKASVGRVLRALSDRCTMLAS